MMIIDSEVLIKNCSTYSKLHSKAVDVLRQADGRTHYQKIAKLLSIPPTEASHLLKQAERLGLARKYKTFYKKNSGILGYMPKMSHRKFIGATISETVRQLGNKKRRIHGSFISFGKSFQEKAYKMSNAYKLLYVTENILRELVRKVLGNEDNWWEKSVNKTIKNDVKDLMDNYRYDAEARRDELEFTHLGQIKEIIIAKSNWVKFLPHLNEKDKHKFNATVDKAIPSRNSIAHSTPLSSTGFKRVEVRFRDILEMIK